MNTRRQFITKASLGGLGLVAASLARADAPMVSPADPAAKQLNYVEDATKVDKAKAPTYQPGQKCGTCNLFQGAAGAAHAPCAIFAGKMVPAGAWCSAYSKKA